MPHKRGNVLISKSIFIILMILEIMFSGCAMQYVDKSGATHSWGLMHVVTKNETLDYYSVVNLQQISTLGLYYSSLDNRSSVGIGYLRSYGISIGENSAVDILLDINKPQNYKIMPFSKLSKGDKYDPNK